MVIGGGELRSKQQQVTAAGGSSRWQLRLAAAVSKQRLAAAVSKQREAAAGSSSGKQQR
jgi:hypothetical protein